MLQVGCIPSLSMYQRFMYDSYHLYPCISNKGRINTSLSMQDSWHLYKCISAPDMFHTIFVHVSVLQVGFMPSLSMYQRFMYDSYLLYPCISNHGRIYTSLSMYLLLAGSMASLYMYLRPRYVSYHLCPCITVPGRIHTILGVTVL